MPAASLHGPFAKRDDTYTGPASAESLRRALMTTESVILHRDPSEATADVTVDGTATGVLPGGDLDAIRTETGAGLPSLRGAILFLEHQRGTGLGEVDRVLTQLIRSRALDGLRGVALGQFLGFARDAGDPALGAWGIRDVLRDRLAGCRRTAQRTQLGTRERAQYSRRRGLSRAAFVMGASCLGRLRERIGVLGA
jgi:muramoyltetrapeptide carboxypeptidase